MTRYDALLHWRITALISDVTLEASFTVENLREPGEWRDAVTEFRHLRRVDRLAVCRRFLRMRH